MSTCSPSFRSNVLTPFVHKGELTELSTRKGEGDSPWEHFDDTIYGGDFLANQPPVKAMCDAAPGIIYLMDRMGVMFNRRRKG